MNEESIAQITDVEKLQYLLTGVTQKNAKQLKRLRVVQKQLKAAKAENHTLSETLTRLKIEKESEAMFRWERDFEKIRADYNEFAFSEVFQLIQDQTFENSDFFKSQIERYKREFQRTESSELKELRTIIASKNEEIIDLKRKLEDLTNELEAQEAAPLSKDVEKTIGDKDQSIAKLRAMIQKFVETDQRKQQQIEDQQQEIERLANAMVNVTGKGASSEDVMKLEMQVEELKAQLAKSRDAQEMEARCEKLTGLLERSNQHYADLNDRYKQLESRLEAKGDKLTLETLHAFEQVAKKTKSTSRAHTAQAIAANEAMMASLKKTVLQYFLTDLGNQENLVPVILELVGCTPEQIQAAVIKFKSNQQFVNRVGSVFGIFG